MKQLVDMSACELYDYLSDYHKHTYGHRPVINTHDRDTILSMINAIDSYHDRMSEELKQNGMYVQ